jgi:hypothetical protein
VCASIESAIFRITYADGGDNSQAVGVDILSTESKVVLCSSLPAGSKLHFAGGVHWARAPPCFHICSIEVVGEDHQIEITIPLYLNGDKLQSVGSELVVPAWLVRKTSDGDGFADIKSDRLAVPIGGFFKGDVTPEESAEPVPTDITINIPFVSTAVALTEGHELFCTVHASFVGCAVSGKKRTAKSTSNSTNEFIDFLGPMACINDNAAAVSEGRPKAKAKSKAAKASKDVDHLIK